MPPKKPAPRNFTDLLDDVATPATPGVVSTDAKSAKGPLLAFHIDDDLKVLLDRAVFWQGKKGSQRAVINLALRTLLTANPDAQRPIPGED